jgi:hypothetical protein
MRGRAFQLFRDFQTAGHGGPFGVCRLILLARIVPERLTADLDDPELEQRIERSIETVSAAGKGPVPSS